jgi:hypothetical protein
MRNNRDAIKNQSIVATGVGSLASTSSEEGKKISPPPAEKRTKKKRTTPKKMSKAIQSKTLEKKKGESKNPLFIAKFKKGGCTFGKFSDEPGRIFVPFRTLMMKVGKFNNHDVSSKVTTFISQFGAGKGKGARYGRSAKTNQPQWCGEISCMRDFFRTHKKNEKRRADRDRMAAFLDEAKNDGPSASSRPSSSTASSSSEVAAVDAPTSFSKSESKDEATRVSSAPKTKTNKTNKRRKRVDTGDRLPVKKSKENPNESKEISSLTSSGSFSSSINSSTSSSFFSSSSRSGVSGSSLSSSSSTSSHTFASASSSSLSGTSSSSLRSIGSGSSLSSSSSTPPHISASASSNSLSDTSSSSLRSVVLGSSLNSSSSTPLRTSASASSSSTSNTSSSFLINRLSTSSVSSSSSSQPSPTSLNSDPIIYAHISRDRLRHAPDHCITLHLAGSLNKENYLLFINKLSEESIYIGKTTTGKKMVSIYEPHLENIIKCYEEAIKRGFREEVFEETIHVCNSVLKDLCDLNQVMEAKRFFKMLVGETSNVRCLYDLTTYNLYMAWLCKNSDKDAEPFIEKARKEGMVSLELYHSWFDFLGKTKPHYLNEWYHKIPPEDVDAFLAEAIKEYNIVELSEGNTHTSAGALTSTSSRSQLR